MKLQNLTLFTVMLTCLIQPAISIAQDSKSQPSNKTEQNSEPADFNRKIYYKNKLEFSLETGWLPINIPWPFDFLLGDQYNKTPLNYPLVPTIASIRWQINHPRRPSILHRNCTLTFSEAFAPTPNVPN